ncbi:MAG: hypothetical protein WA584_07440 [Pyrinomonadaceae bacterium]
MENIKEKLSFLFKLYFSYMKLAFWGVVVFIFTYILLILLINSPLTTILFLLGALMIVSLLGYKYYRRNQLAKPKGFFLLKISQIFFDNKEQKEIFVPTVGDWNEEIFEALSKKDIWRARWINVRYTYAFLAAMWQKSPIGDLIEFVTKIAK